MVLVLVAAAAVAIFLNRDDDLEGGPRPPITTPDATAPADVLALPPDTGVVDVTADPYNAAGDGVTDDTAAIRQAILDNDATSAVERAAPRTIYLPAGTYRVTDSVIADSSSVRVLGAGRDHTVIKLDDGAVGFGDGEHPKVVLQSGNFNREVDLANTGFANYYQHFTLDIGSGNAGAIGIRYDVANSGAMQHVTIRSSDPQRRGAYGLFFTTSPGPALVQDVVIDGFEHGIYLDDKITNGLTFQDIVLRNQTVAGITNVCKNIVIENLQTDNVPVAIRTVEPSATVMIIDSSLGGHGDGPAIDLQQEGFLYARGVSTSGFGNIVTVAGRPSFVGADSLREWGTRDYQVGDTVQAWTEDNDYVGLNLPVKQAPQYDASDLGTWADVTDFVEPQDGEDHGPALQRAIDSGAEVVYFPYGAYALDTSVVVRGNVRKIEFFFSSVRTTNPGTTISVSALDGGDVTIGNVVTNVKLQQEGADTVVIRNLNPAGGGITTTPAATGDVFIENAGAHVRVTAQGPASIWGRSVDRANVEWVNDGGTLWCLACNIETRWSPTVLTGGSQTEIIGGPIDNLGEVHGVDMGPLFDVQDAYLSVLLPGTLRSEGSWDYLIRDEHEGGTTDVLAADLQTIGTSGGDRRILLPMYVTPGYPR